MGAPRRAGPTGPTGPCGGQTCVNSTDLLCYSTVASSATGANNLCADPTTGFCVNQTSAQALTHVKGLLPCELLGPPVL